MTGSDLINNFRLYIDSSTELSTTEELALANRVYKKICRNRPWEFLRKTATGSVSVSVPYVSLPADFGFLVANKDNEKVVFVGDKPYKVINYNEKRDYKDRGGYCYIDLANNRLVFTKQPETVETYEYDYSFVPPDLTTETSPIFPMDFHPMIYHLMATEGFIIQLFEKARSYQNENQAKANEYMKDLCWWNSQFYE